MNMERWGWWRAQAEEERSQWEIITTVRNHFDALVSWSFMKTFALRRVSIRYVEGLVDSTREYLLDPHRLWSYHVPDATRLLRYETLGEDLNDVLRDRGIQETEIPRENVSTDRRGRPYQEFFDLETRRFVEGLYREEMKELDYSWED